MSTYLLWARHYAKLRDLSDKAIKSWSLLWRLPYCRKGRETERKEGKRERGGEKVGESGGERGREREVTKETLIILKL